MEKHLTINGGQWELAATLHYPLNTTNDGPTSRYPIVVICHGFVGNRIGSDRLFVTTARQLAQQGYLVLRFDYAGCGESQRDYGATTMESWIQQTRYVLDYALDIDGVDHERVILLGHSLGGAVALLTAANDKRIRTLVLWSPVAHPFTDIVGIVGRELYDQAVKAGSSDYLSYSFYPGFFASLAANQPLREVSRFIGDVFLAHGTSDDVIPVDYTFLYQKLFWTRLEGRCDKEIIFQGDHTFSSRESRDILLDKTIAWLNEQETRKQEWNGWTI